MHMARRRPAEQGQAPTLSDPLRVRLTDPVGSTEQLRDLLSRWRQFIGTPEHQQEFDAEYGPVFSKIILNALRSNLAAHEKGRAQALQILELVEGSPYADLVAFLKAHRVSIECIAFLLAENKRLTRSLAASEAARMKNADPRSFVADAWAARADAGQSKASFARMIEHEVKRRFGVAVTADRIARYWLPKG